MGLHKADLCGLGIDKDAKPPVPKTCSTEQVQAHSDICTKFKPDLFSLEELRSSEDATDKALEVLGAVLGGSTSKQLRLFAAAALNEEITRKNGFQFNQKVYVRFRGTAKANYVSNFMAARVLMADKNNVYLFSSAKGKSRIRMTIPNEAGKIYTIKEFKPLRAQMKKAKRFVDPVVKKDAMKAVISDAEYNLNAIPNELKESQFNHGAVVADMSDVAQANKAKVKRGSYTLVDHARDLASGKIVSKSKAQLFGRKFAKGTSTEIELN